MKTLQSDEIYTEIEKGIKEAKKCVKIVSAWLKGNVVEKLLNSLPEGVDLEVILRASELQDLLITDDYVFRKIKEKKGKVFLNERLHAKFILIDDKKAVVGSANFTGAGLSEYSQGNIEAAVYYDINDDKKELEKLTSYYEKIKADSTTFDDSLIGFSINPVKTSSFEFILLEPEIEEQSYVEVRKGDLTILGKVTSIYSYDMGFFANPFSAGESPVFGPINAFKTLFTEKRSSDWKKAATYSYLKENGDKVRVAVAKVLGVIREGMLDTLMKPFDVGEAVYKASSDTIKELSKKNFSGKEMNYPIEVGTFKNSDEKVFVDGKEVITKHMLVLGTTGSGKSHFIKIFLSRLVKNYGVQVFILDPHGEYYEELQKLGVQKERIRQVIFKDTLFPLYPEEVENLVTELGYSHLIKGNSQIAKKNRNVLTLVKPNLKRTVFKEKNLYDLLSSLKKDEGTYQKIEEEALELLGEEALKTQVETFNTLSSALNSNESVIIFNFSKVTDPPTRVNLAGLIMQELFNKNREEKKERIVVLEEAHSFAPEGSYGDVSASKTNLSLTMARKIASEGRKFNLGLIVITQRPAQVSKYVLSQANTQAMFRTMNYQDLEAIKNYVEFAGRDLVELLPSLQIGTGILSGLGVPFPIVVTVDRE